MTYMYKSMYNIYLRNMFTYKIYVNIHTHLFLINAMITKQNGRDGGE